MGTCQSTTTTRYTATTKGRDDESHVTINTLAPVDEASGEVKVVVPKVAIQEEPSTTHPIMKSIEQIQKDSGKPFGRILDAGTGLNSLSWIAHLLKSNQKEGFGISTTEDWIAVTASDVMAREVIHETKHLGFNQDELENKHLIVGNWMEHDEGDDEYVNEKDNGTKPLLHGETFDTILVDYLIGAMDAFSPYRQDCIFERLVQHLKPGGRIYLIGTEPLPNKVMECDDYNHENQNLVCRVKNIRDSCILLAGERCYREYPLSWTIRNMKRASGLNVVKTSRFNLLHRVEDLYDQLGVARSMLKYIRQNNNDQDLASSLEGSIDKLKYEARRTMMNTKNNNVSGGSIHLGFDYLVVAEKESVE